METGAGESSARKRGQCYYCQGPHLKKDCPACKAYNECADGGVAQVPKEELGKLLEAVDKLLAAKGMDKYVEASSTGSLVLTTSAQRALVPGSLPVGLWSGRGPLV